MSNEVAYWPRYLDALGKELERRGLPSVRYADDFVIFTNSEVAAPGLRDDKREEQDRKKQNH